MRLIYIYFRPILSTKLKVCEICASEQNLIVLDLKFKQATGLIALFFIISFEPIIMSYCQQKTWRWILIGDNVRSRMFITVIDNYKLYINFVHLSFNITYLLQLLNLAR